VPGVLIVGKNNFEQIGNISRYFDIPVFDNVAEINTENDFSSDNVQSTGKRRVGQQKFSKLIKENYNYACAVCGISEPEFLIAGHISAWSEDINNRLNPQNGICFCAFHDKAFEHGYLGISDNFEIVLNQRINHYSPIFPQLKGVLGKRITLPNNNFPDRELLRKHRAKHKLSEYGNQRTSKNYHSI
jgi:predicted restriction endonuclease